MISRAHNGPVNAFTVDLEDWFQGLTSTNPQVERWASFESRVVPATQLLLGLLREQNVQATFFVLGYVADQHPDLIRQIAGAGHEIALHGYYHRFVNRLTPAEFAQELEMGIEAIYRITGSEPQGHRAPYFSVNGSTPWAFDCMRAAGLAYDSSVFPTRNMLYGYPGAPRFPYLMDGLVELPASTVTIGGVTVPVAGGFYVRVLPYLVTKWAVARLNRAGHPAIMYVHPWELDLGQRYNQVTARERITHYHGRRSLAEKLRRLLADFRFTTMAEVIQMLRSEGQLPEVNQPQLR
jgi:polysaccharide deacetylase family protein (PEP-CTERM system associated)